ncbi:MAG: hypothetical protein JNL84_04220 [Candidatus Accumulibacter sp.]|nr:hypothetical protein [Accumulibacter sp.]
MTVVLRFSTKMFDVTRERENPINPIPGESLLRWLNTRLGHGARLTDPDPEDWGWYSYVEWDGAQYMLGSSASEEEEGKHEWVLQIVRQRSLKERWLGHGKATVEDPCVKSILKLLLAEQQFERVAVEGET